VRDAYKSIIEAFVHAGAANDARVQLKWIEGEDIEQKGAAAFLSDLDGIVVPGGFGERGIEGKIQAARYARECSVPYLGLCLVCRSRRSSSRATWRAGRRPTRASLIPRPRRR